MLRKAWLYIVAALFVMEAALFVIDAQAATVRVNCECGGSVSCSGYTCNSTPSSCECRNERGRVTNYGVCDQC